MGAELMRRVSRVQEERPFWRGARRSGGAERRGRLWRPEVWETPYGIERYPGATVLEDWAVTEGDAASTVRVLARYTVLRVIQLSAAGLLSGAKLRTERRIATEHVALLPADDWERMALRRVNDLSAERPPAGLAGAVLVAAEAAAKRGHAMSAFAFYRTAHHLAMEAGAWEEAGRAARGIARLALLDEARYSTRLWERRAAVLERWAARARLAHEQITDGPAGTDAPEAG